MDKAILEAESWAQQQWGEAFLGDPRRQRRAVAVGAALASQPGQSLPLQMGSWASLKAAYRLLSCPQVSHARLSEGHWHQTGEAAWRVPSHGVVLFIQEGSSLDYTPHRHTQAHSGVGHYRRWRRTRVDAPHLSGAGSFGCRFSCQARRGSTRSVGSGASAGVVSHSRPLPGESSPAAWAAWAAHRSGGVE